MLELVDPQWWLVTLETSTEKHTSGMHQWNVIHSVDLSDQWIIWVQPSPRRERLARSHLGDGPTEFGTQSTFWVHLVAPSFRVRWNWVLVDRVKEQSSNQQGVTFKLAGCTGTVASEQIGFQFQSQKSVWTSVELKVQACWDYSLLWQELTAGINQHESVLCLSNLSTSGSRGMLWGEFFFLFSFVSLPFLIFVFFLALVFIQVWTVFLVAFVVVLFFFFI